MFGLNLEPLMLTAVGIAVAVGLLVWFVATLALIKANPNFEARQYLKRKRLKALIVILLTCSIAVIGKTMLDDIQKEEQAQQAAP